MAFGSSDAAPQPEQKLLNVRPSRAATNEEARPVTYFCGQARFAVTWLDNARNIVTKKIHEEQQAGKNDSQTVTTGVEYRADLLALVCIGPVNKLRKIWFNGDKAWGDGASLGSSSHEDFTLDDDRGEARIYFGTSDQAVFFADDDDHPSYRLQCVFRLENFLFGFNTTSAPSIELEVCRWPDFNWLVAGDYKIGEDSNPVAIIADMLTHPLLYNLPDSVLDKVQLAKVARQLKAEGFGLSPVLNRAQKMDQFLTELCSYFDGVPTWVNGKLQLQLQRDAPARSTLTVVNESNLVSPPKIEGGDFTATYNQTRVTFTRRDNDYKEAAVNWTDHGNVSLTTSLRTQTLQRPWVTAEAVASRIAAQAGRRYSCPTIKGKVTVFERGLRKLRKGDFFRLRYVYPEIDLVCKITERRIERPESRQIEFIWEAEPTQAGDSIDETDPRSGLPSTDPVASPHLRILELPFPLAVASTATIIALADRGNGLVTQLKVLQSRTLADYAEVLTSNNFCRSGVLVGDFLNGSAIDHSNGLTLDMTGAIDSDVASLSLDQAVVNTWLLLVDDEFMSVGQVVLTAPFVYQLKGLIRGRYDSLRATHVSGSRAYLFASMQIARYASVAYALGQTWNYKIQPFAGRNGVNSAAIAPVSTTLGFASLRPPAPLNLRVNGERGGSFNNALALVIGYSQTTWALPDFFNWFYFPTGFDPEMASVIEIYNGVTLKRTEPVTAGAIFSYSGAHHTADFPAGGAGTIRVWTVWRGYRSARSIDLSFTSTI